MGYLEDRRKKKFADKTPEIGNVASSYDEDNNVLSIRITPTTKKYIDRVEVTVRDFKLRDEVFKLKRRGDEFLLIMDAFLNREYDFSFYLTGKDGKYARVEKTIDDIRKSIENKPADKDDIQSQTDKKDAVESVSTENTSSLWSMEFVPMRRSWPTSSQYAQSLQNPSFSISKNCEPLLNINLLKNPNVNYPSIIHGAGNFGIVFKYTKGESQNALKCFTRGSPNIQRRYYEVSKAIGNTHIPFLVPLQFYPDSIRVMNKPREYYPSVSMGWIAGKPLNSFIEDNLSNADILKNTAKNLVTCVIAMQKSQIAHGDLSSDNIIVDQRGSVHMIDYDGMYVPSLETLGSEELGHESFQHPKRGRYYGSKLDNFSILIIYASLIAVAKNVKYWQYNEKDPDKMLFDISDFITPEKSAVLKSMRLDGGKLKKLAELIEKFAPQTPDWDGFDPQALIKMK